jgi:hypothetical protein
MASSKRKLSAGRAPLPYTPEDALHIRQTGCLYHAPSFPRPFNQSGFYLDNLSGRPSLSWPPELPKHDTRGNPSVPEFESWKKAQDSKIGIPGNYFSFKGGGKVACHSSLEQGHLSYFEMNPFVVEIRTQYPEWSRSQYAQLKGIQGRMLKRSLMSIDFMLTLKIPGRSVLHYHGVSTKPYEFIRDPAVKRRHLREAAMLAEWGCTHEIMTEHTFTMKEVHNNQRLLQYMLHTEDISTYQGEAAIFADMLYGDKVPRSCDAKIDLVAHHFGWTRDKGYRVFAIANFLGYLAVDHTYEILPEKPLHLRVKQL